MVRRVAVSMAIAMALAGAIAPGSQAQSPVVVIVSDPDRQFLTQAAQGGAAEVQMGQLAASKAVTDAVRQFGARMVADHGAANAELQALAQQKGVAVGLEPGAHHRTIYDRLAVLAGPEFDRTYIAEMVIDHDKDVAEFERISQTARDPDIRAWAGNKLPTLRQHQALARQLHATMAQAPVAVAVPAALPAAVVVVTPPPAPWCAGSWRVDGGTNFGGCSR
jgi:putative membrane protein